MNIENFEKLERLVNNQDFTRRLLINLLEWEKFILFNHNLEHLDKKTLEAMVNYMARNLSRFQIPRKTLIEETSKNNYVPKCGYLGCSWDEEHVH